MSSHFEIIWDIIVFRFHQVVFFFVVLRVSFREGVLFPFWRGFRSFFGQIGGSRFSGHLRWVLRCVHLTTQDVLMVFLDDIIYNAYQYSIQLSQVLFTCFFGHIHLYYIHTHFSIWNPFSSDKNQHPPSTFAGQDPDQPETYQGKAPGPEVLKLKNALRWPFSKESRQISNPYHLCRV